MTLIHTDSLVRNLTSRSIATRAASTEAGIFDAAELALLGRVFDKLKAGDLLPATRDAIASRVIANFTAGVTDEAELVSLSKQPLGR